MYVVLQLFYEGRHLLAPITLAAHNKYPARADGDLKALPISATSISL